MIIATIAVLIISWGVSANSRAKQVKSNTAKVIIIKAVEK